MPNRRLLTGAVFIEACLQAAYAELERLLAIPEMHRTRLKMEMRQVFRLIAEEGPEGLERFREGERGVVLQPDERRWRRRRVPA